MDNKNVFGPERPNDKFTILWKMVGSVLVMSMIFGVSLLFDSNLITLSGQIKYLKETLSIFLIKTSLALSIGKLYLPP